jgi:hypothetical protein
MNPWSTVRGGPRDDETRGGQVAKRQVGATEADKGAVTRGREQNCEGRYVNPKSVAGTLTVPVRSR